ncbi:MAG: A/G-specific adenine glycosylase [Chlamydiae bacterium]|nr:A/G-specific adenine glycosylase [Chlamydiota bacterium]
MPISDSEKLRQWFLKEKREFPWRKNLSPYRVWISEIMLQQTRASVVVDYFERWMERYPDIESLAKASEEELIKMWEGLGYYNRVRNIRKAAIYFLTHHQGQIPDSKDALLKAPGLGSYTVGAILSFAFQQKEPAVDANVLRVMARYHGIKEEISSMKVQKKIYNLTSTFLPLVHPEQIMEGLIELGANICGRSPQCFRCPLKGGCVGFTLGIADALPLKKKRKEAVHLFKDVFVIRCGVYFLIHRKPLGEVLGGLCEFLSIERSDTSQDFIKKLIPHAIYNKDLDRQQYGYTHHVVELFPSLWETISMLEMPECKWVHFKELLELPFTSGHKRILTTILKENFYECPTY